MGEGDTEKSRNLVEESHHEKIILVIRMVFFVVESEMRMNIS